MLVFRPKYGGEPWTASLTQAAGGCDLCLMLDPVNSTPKSGWMLELWVNPDGSVGGQVTSRPGEDAMAIFTSTRDKFSVGGNCGGPVHVISDARAEVDNA